MALKMSRQAYAEMFGPTVGDRVRLADTALFIEVEKDFTVYGEEVKFGGGKVIRDGMGQGQGTQRRRCRYRHHQCPHRRSLGHLQGRRRPQERAPSGESAKPEIRTFSRKSPFPIGAATEIIAGEGMILTAGGIDTHIHFICPQQIEEALTSGVTTMIGGGTGPAAGTSATTCTPGPWHIRSMLLGGGSLSHEPRIPRQGQRERAGAGARADSRRRGGPEASRGLGHDSGGHR